MKSPSIQLELGLPVIQSYKRLSYTPWHAIAELVDNATQSYFNNQEILDEAYATASESLWIGVVYEREGGGLLRVSDNAMGMSYDELTNALRVGFPPAITSGRSKYGMGMKTASCWIGNWWTIRTKKLGETTEHRVTVDVNKIASGDNDLNYVAVAGRPGDQHYTIIEIKNHNQEFRGRTIPKIRDFLRSMYRQDLRRGWATIEWRGVPLKWDDSDFQFLHAMDGSVYKKDFDFYAAGKRVMGWVGVLGRGSTGRGNAGFSILHADRVVRGWPESWRPETIYGLERNDLINQRLLGEIHLNDFEVSHTKDGILWHADEQEEVERLLKEECADYIAIADQDRRGRRAPTGPSDLEVQTAIDEFQQELRSSVLSDTITLELVPPPEAVHQAQLPLKDSVSGREPTFQAKFAGNPLEIRGYLVHDASANDPYVVVEATSDERVLIIVNTQHPHWKQLGGSEGVLNYLRHCTYDGIAEWQARRHQAGLDPGTIKVLKDRLLRLPLEIEMES